MRLLVANTPVEDASFDLMQMTVGEFNNPACHLFILSHDFNEVIVELSDDVHLGMLKPLMSRTKVIPKIDGEITSHIISLLCELYPEKSAAMRYAFIRNREDLVALVGQMREEGKWEEFY